MATYLKLLVLEEDVCLLVIWALEGLAGQCIEFGFAQDVERMNFIHSYLRQNNTSPLPLVAHASTTHCASAGAWPL